MLRRSSRLRLSGYYLPEAPAAQTGSDGPACRISYRETPARIKRKSWARKGPTWTSNSFNESPTPYLNGVLNDGIYDMDVTSNFKVAAQRRDKKFKTDSCTDFPQSNTHGFPSVYPYTDEQHYPDTLQDSIHDLKHSTFSLAHVFRSPDLAVVIFCVWMENIWHMLKRNISRLLLYYDLQLSRCSAGMRNAIKIFLIMFLFCGIWNVLPCGSSFNRHQAEMFPAYKNANVPTRDASHLSYEILEKWKREIADAREREAKMMKDIMWLKLQNEKQKLKFEMLQKDVTMQDMNLESDYQQQISDLRSDVSNIRETSNHLKQRLEMQNPLNTKDVTDIVQSALSLYRSDGTGMADYALESSGGSVIKTRCSETYPSKSSQISLFGIPLWYYSESPRTIIQPEVHPGKCWAFRGSKGFLSLSLSYPIRITHVTLEHIPKALSPTGNIDSAPKDFVVYGLSSQCDGGKLLGNFMYDQNQDPIQTFKIPESTQVYSMVELRIMSNWGHPEYTCVYRFRVHGVPWVTKGLA